MSNENILNSQQEYFIINLLKEEYVDINNSYISDNGKVYLKLNKKKIPDFLLDEQIKSKVVLGTILASSHKFFDSQPVEFWNEDDFQKDIDNTDFYIIYEALKPKEHLSEKDKKLLRLKGSAVGFKIVCGEISDEGKKYGNIGQYISAVMDITKIFFPEKYEPVLDILTEFENSVNEWLKEKIRLYYDRNFKPEGKFLYDSLAASTYCQFREMTDSSIVSYPFKNWYKKKIYKRE